MMPGGVAAYGGYKAESPEARALRGFASDQFDYRDQGRNLAQLNNAVGFISGMMRKQQSAIDKANQNFVQQLQSLVTDFIVALGGGGDTGLDLGDFKYVLQMIGALFGIADEDGNLTIPINPINAAWHFFSNYIGISANFRELIDQLIDNGIATVLDIFGEVPVVGQALQQLAVFIADIRDLLLPVSDAVQALFDALNIDLDDIQGIADFFGPFKPLIDALFEALEGIDLPDFSLALRALIQIGKPLIDLLAAGINLIALFIKLLTGNADAGDFEDALKSFTLIADPTAGGGAGLGTVGIGTGLIQTFLNPTGLLTTIEGLAAAIGLDFSGPAAFMASLVSGLSGFLGIDFGGILDVSAMFELFSMIPIGNLGNKVQNLLFNPDYKGAGSLDGQDIWFWDDTITFQGSNNAWTTGNGTLRELLSNNITVAEDQTLEFYTHAAWSAVTGTGSPARLAVLKFHKNVDNTFTWLGTEILDTVAFSANQAAPVKLEASWDVPTQATTIDMVRVGLHVPETITGGTVRFFKNFAGKSQLLQLPWIKDLPQELQGLAAFAQSTLNTLFGGIFGNMPTGDVGFEDIFDGLQNIPPGNVLGLQGGTIVDTFQGTIDTLWGGFARLFGQQGKSIFDVASLTADTVSVAETGLEVSEWNNAILGNRTSESLFTGTDPTEVSNFDISRLANGAADPVTLNATAGFAPMAFFRATKSDMRGIVHWIGKGFTGITSLFIDLYKFNYTTSQYEVFHTSTNQIGIVGSTWGNLKYVMPAGFQLNMGETIGVGWRVVGAGTHSIAGLTFGAWQPNDTFVPLKQGAIRTDSAATTISFATLAGYYSSNVPWVGFAIDTGDIIPDYHAPRTTQITTTGAFNYPVPDWADEVLEFLCSGAGGGQGGDPAIFQTGQGGKKGIWSVRKLVRGVDFPSTPGVSFAGTVGIGGANGNWPAQDGENGAATTRNAIPSGNGVHTVVGGLGGRNMGSPKSGEAAGVSPTLDGFSFPGGGPASNGKPGANGQSPGGGGGGGDGATWGVAWNGGDGARGVAIYVAKQVD